MVNETGMDEERICRELLQNLQIKENRTNTLTEIKSSLQLCINSTIARRLLKSPELLGCLEEASENGLLASDILSMCLKSLSTDLSETFSFIEKFLPHYNLNVQKFGLRELERTLNDAPDSFGTETLVVLVAKCLASNEASVGTPSIGLLVRMIPNFVERGRVENALHPLLEESDIVRCRLYEVAVKVGLQSIRLMNFMKPFLQPAVKELDADDILLQLNILQILSELVKEQYGITFLVCNDVVDKILYKIQHLECNPQESILKPPLLVFCAKLSGIKSPTIYERTYPKVINMLFECVTSDDLSILPVAYDSFGYISHQHDGKSLLYYHFGALMKSTIKHFSTVIRTLPHDLKVRLIRCIDCIVQPEHDIGAVDNELSTIAQTWYNYLTDEENLNFVMDYLRTPFSDMKRAALSMLKSLIRYDWGQLYLRNTGGLLEYLLDRKQETDKDVKLEKYEIIRNLTRSKVLDSQTIAELKKYVSEGPFYVQAVLEVAVEGGP